MMNLVNELQVSAEKDDVLTVLRKTKRLASKLDRQDIAEWLRSEQFGYQSVESVPDYRQVHTELAYNTNGGVPAGYGRMFDGIKDLPSAGLTCPIPVFVPISAVLQWIESIAAGRGVYQPIEEGSDLSRSLHSLYHFHPLYAQQISFVLHLNSSQIQAIPEQIKDKVLDWACALEAAGVTGDGLSFSAKDKEIAHAITFNISGNIEQLNNLGTNFKGHQ